MKTNLQELCRYRELLYTIAWRDIKVRYKQSIMGFLWALLMPGLIVLSGIAVRCAYAMLSHAPLSRKDIASIAVKAVPWAFLVSSLKFACNSLTGNRELVTKVYFPKEILPVAAVLSSLFDLLAASLVLIVLLAVLQVGWSVSLLWAPPLMLGIVMIAAGAGLLVAAASLFFRDVKYIVDVLLTFGIFFTPVLFDASTLGDKARWVFLNPVAPLVDGLGACVAHHEVPHLFWLAYSWAVGAVVLFGGYRFFKHLEPGFAESI